MAEQQRQSDETTKQEKAGHCGKQQSQSGWGDEAMTDSLCFAKANKKAGRYSRRLCCILINAVNSGF
jgi:hypothetical protein